MLNKSLLTVLSLLFSLTTHQIAIAGEVTGAIGSASVDDEEMTINAPANLRISSASTSSVILNWDPVPDASSYKIYRSGVSNVNWDTVNSVGTTTNTSFTNTGLESGSTYYFRIRAFANEIVSDWSGPVSVIVSSSVSSGGSSSSSSSGSDNDNDDDESKANETFSSLADATGDGVIDILDFNVLMINWGVSEENNSADFNGDGQVDFFDFNLLMINWS